jgi:Holliday junction resolvase RusA-like endonuclease
MPKARPVFNTKTKNVYMPADYEAWKGEVQQHLGIQGVKKLNLDMPMRLEAVFGTDYIEFQLFPMEGHIRAKWVKADIDNLTGGLMDALEQGDIINNDKQIVRSNIWIAGRGRESS